MTPILPFINDTPENIRGLLNYCVEAGVRGIVLFDMGMTLREYEEKIGYEQLSLEGLLNSGNG